MINPDSTLGHSPPPVTRSVEEEASNCLQMAWDPGDSSSNDAGEKSNPWFTIGTAGERDARR